jgi:MFS family permease
MSLTQPARIAIIPEMVNKELVLNAISLSQIGATVFGLAGPLLGGYLIDAHGFAIIYYLATASYAISTIVTFFLPLTGAAAVGRRSTLGDVVAGWKYFRRETFVLLIIVFAMCHMISGQPYQQLLPVFTDSILKVGASGLGILMTVSGIGSLLASFIFASLPNRKRGVLLIFSGLIMGLALMVFSYSRWFSLSLVMIPFIGLSPTMHGTMTNTLIQSYVEPDYRGRMQSFQMVASSLAGFGTFFVGVLTDSIGVQWAVGGAAAFLTVASIGFFIFARPLVKLE